MNQNRPSAIEEFYNTFGERLLRDYVYGNARVAAAVARVSSIVKNNTNRILDIGCGIGVSSDAYLRAFPWLSVDAVDISPNSISMAKALFQRGSLEFFVSDMREPPTPHQYDIIALLDVYEHIPRATWPDFHALLASCLLGDGMVVLTVPSPSYQDYLATTNPGALQIVDERVGLEDIIRLASDLHGHLMLYEMMTIWNTYDYVHAVISRSPPTTQKPLSPNNRHSLLRRVIRYATALARRADNRAVKHRRRLVLERLGRTV